LYEDIENSKATIFLLLEDSKNENFENFANLHDLALDDFEDCLPEIRLHLGNILEA